ncbi:hypothetical protein [Clostridium sp. Marseille-P2415]|uniref:hypothetical protein n=1 Tax=Clostridium sp. Marseille-P2415 TaxID=1805471 RepID=UPI000988625C|nr:hypothetical protein [Clostridium sp. Marseille-P2415]
MKEDKIIENIKSKTIFVDCNFDKYNSKCRLITNVGNGTLIYILNEDKKNGIITLMNFIRAYTK